MQVTIVLDCQDADALVPFWEAALDYRRSDTLDEYHVLVPRTADDGGPVLLLAHGGPTKTVKNRMHLDVHPDDAVAHITRLQRLGATVISDPVERFGMWWQVVADPEGNELCVVSGAYEHEHGDASA
jgi:predicted enzyme related to lactoylglutathione lyase